MHDDHTLEEQLLVTDFRRLDAAGKRDLLHYAASLLKRSYAGEEAPKQENQCRLDAKCEERPETAEEPIFTE